MTICPQFIVVCNKAVKPTVALSPAGTLLDVGSKSRSWPVRCPAMPPKHCMRSSACVPPRMDILAQVLDRVRLGGTLLFHFELGHPWHLELPAGPYALFHYLSRGSATLALGKGREIKMTEGDFVVITREEPHVFYSDRRAKPLRIIDIDRASSRFGVIRHGSRAKPSSTMICGSFTVSRPISGVCWSCFRACSC